MEPLKEMFNADFYRNFAAVFEKADKHFNAGKFIKEVTKGMEVLSLNQRLRNTSIVLHDHVTADFKRAVALLYKVAPGLRKGYTALVLPDFVGLYGKEHFELSMDALKYFTSLGSSEFAVREFLKTDLFRTLKVMEKWAGDTNDHVRRLASEGSRPRLPWSFKLDPIIKDPSLTRNILVKLRADESLYVRKSVANHLNDISKENTEYMLHLVSTWDKTDPNTAWIIKHASRSLIKKGHAGSLALFNFEKNALVELTAFRLSASAIQQGEILLFQFFLESKKSTPQKLVIDYAIHYPKVSGTLSRKVFKLKEINLLAAQKIHISKKQKFDDLTTRKHYPGNHILEIIVNGVKAGEKKFVLSV